MTPLTLTTIAPDRLDRYARIPMRVTVDTVLQPTPVCGGLGGLTLTPQPVATPYTKDYDDHGAPTTWPRDFDLTAWTLWLAERDGEPVGGAAVAYAPDHPRPLSGRADAAVLWDLRVAPDARRQGVGRALMRAACADLKRRGARLLKVETQNVNPGACAFYQACGCTLGTIDRFAYTDPSVAHEVMLVWYLDLAAAQGAAHISEA